MGSTFVDSEFGDTVESQLTLGTASLLGIFFGLVMVCGMFFGVGYSIGRRNSSSSIAASTPPARIVPAPVMAQPAAPATAPYANTVENSQPAPLVIVPRTSQPVPPPIEVASPPKAPVIAPAPRLAEPAPVPLAAPLLAKAAPAERNAPAMNHELLTAKTQHPATLPTGAQPYVEAKVRIPKPSAIQPTQDQPNTRIPLERVAPGPQFTAKNLPSPYFVWTPPFDVHYKKGFQHSMNRAAARQPQGSMTGISHPPAAYTAVARPNMAHLATSSPAMTVQVAALSRQDDAQVLVSALRERGFTPSIASGTEDTLYHVQVGPFSRDVAFATRQRLIAKGYNATLK